MHASTRLRSTLTRTGRALTAVTAVAVAASTGVALAPSASAFYGTDTTVKSALLTTTQVANLSGWNDAANPLHGAVLQLVTYDWFNSLTTTSPITDAQTAPEVVNLVVVSSTAARDGFFNDIKKSYAADATSISTNTGSAFTADTLNPASGSDPAYYETVSLRKAGSDGFAFAACTATATTTTTAAQRATCANPVANAQAAAWAKISPTLVWRSTSAVKAKLLTGSAAHKATRLASSTKTRISSTKSKNVAHGGRQVTRAYLTTSTRIKTLRISVPYLVQVTQYGNRTNAGVAFAASKAADRKLFKTLYDQTASRYTAVTKIKSHGRTTTLSVTVLRDNDVLVVGSCIANPYKRPSASKVRTCSRRLAAAELTKATPLFKYVR